MFQSTAPDPAPAQVRLAGAMLAAPDIAHLRVLWQTERSALPRLADEWLRCFEAVAESPEVRDSTFLCGSLCFGIPPGEPAQEVLAELGALKSNGLSLKVLLEAGDRDASVWMLQSAAEARSRQRPHTAYAVQAPDDKVIGATTVLGADSELATVDILACKVAWLGAQAASSDLHDRLHTLTDSLREDVDTLFGRLENARYSHLWTASRLQREIMARAVSTELTRLRSELSIQALNLLHLRRDRLPRFYDSAIAAAHHAVAGLDEQRGQLDACVASHSRAVALADVRLRAHAADHQLRRDSAVALIAFALGWSEIIDTDVARGVLGTEVAQGSGGWLLVAAVRTILVALLAVVFASIVRKLIRARASA
ncbi:MAG: hypothetical protein IT457_20495 [Planctomycetes bacterium]|nr:hypothetical protein [Planctomycetota bacterium]